jgi:hypothetical protein
LQRLGEPVPENKKVRDILNGINDPQCTNIKLNVLSNTTFMNDFSQAVNYIASAIDMTTKNSSTTARQISELTRSGIHNSGRGRGRGRGGRNSRGRGRGRGGRNQDTGRGRGRSSDESIGSRTYSPQERQNLSSSQCQEVYRQRERLATAQTVAAVISESINLNVNGQGQGTDDISTITALTNAQRANSNQNQDDNRGNPTRNTVQLNLNNVSQALTRRNSSLGAYKSIMRSSLLQRVVSSSQQIKEQLGYAELDSHAYTCGVNNVARILEYTNQVAEVTGFANSLEPLRNIPIIKAAVAYDHPDSGEVIVIIINQALYFGDELDEILLNPNQIRAQGNTVDDIPKIFGGKSHSITFPSENFSIPLELRGIISFFPVRTPSLSEIENCFMVVLTPEPEWDPYAESYQNAEREFSIKICQTQEREIIEEMIPRIINMSQVNIKDKSLFLSSEQLARTGQFRKALLGIPLKQRHKILFKVL